MEVVQKSLSDRGFSEEASRRIIHNHAASTSAIYKSKWNIFSSYCRTKRIDPFLASDPQISEFLIYLFKDKKLAHKTLEGYRTAIAEPIRLKSGKDISKSMFLTRLLQSFARERPSIARPYPNWDLAFVLQSLTKEP